MAVQNYSGYKPAFRPAEFTVSFRIRAPKAPLSSIESNRPFRNEFATDFMLNGMTTGV
jgi:hypothetical protein